jgi:hypothetical protein
MRHGPDRRNKTYKNKQKEEVNATTQTQVLLKSVKEYKY